MRIPHDPSSQPGSHGQSRQRDAISPNPDARPGESPDQAWQKHFFLAPNVRFTRTPDRDAKKAPGEAQPVEAAVQTAQPAKPQAVPAGQVGRPVAVALGGVAAARPAARPQPVLAPAASRPATARPAVAKPTAVVQQPRQQAHPSPQPVTRQAQPVAPPPQPQPLRVVNAAQAPQARAKPARPWTHLSDHAFFELVEPRIADGLDRPAALSPTSTAAPQPASVPPADALPRLRAAHDILARYRVIDCPGGVAPSAEIDCARAAPQPATTAPRETANDDRPPARSLAARPQPTQPQQAQPQPAQTQPAPAARARPITIVPPAPKAASQQALPVMGKVVPIETTPGYDLPSPALLQQPPEGQGFYMTQEQLEKNADLLESVLEDFGVKGEIIHVRPGPVVTLYEFEPAPGVKSSRVINLADDIARSMSAVSARVAVVPGRNVIGVELPNETRETVYFREMIQSNGFRNTNCKLALCLGKTIGGEPVIAELAKMPHLLVAGTTGSGKSVAINTMILSLLYRLKPEECRLIMVDPKMLELSVYDDIPHLLTPVVTDPKKAVTALKWAVREMEDRYRKMARLGVRNIEGYNQRAAAARDKGETVTMQVQAGFDRDTGEPIYEDQEIDLSPMPFIVVIVDEMADLMMVAGKEIEGAIQRLAQMARAAGIHLIMATQRPSVDVITGTIKANFPTRISFQVTSKIDSRTILGEQGAEQLLGQGDMLHMMGGGRIARVHGPFVSDEEVEKVVAHLKAQGRPTYLDTVTVDEDEQVPEIEDKPVADSGTVAADDTEALFEEAVKIVRRDKKCSTSYIQRRLGIGYNRAASLVERMEKEGLVGAPNHVGKREILTG